MYEGLVDGMLAARMAQDVDESRDSNNAGRMYLQGVHDTVIMLQVMALSGGDVGGVVAALHTQTCESKECPENGSDAVH